MKTIITIVKAPFQIAGALLGFAIIAAIATGPYLALVWIGAHIEYFILPAVVVGLIWLAARKG